MATPQNPPVAIEARAELRQIKSMVDGSYNITLNFPEDCLEQVKTLMGWLALDVKVVVINEPEQDKR